MGSMTRPRRNQPDIDLDKAGILEAFDALDAPRVGLWWFQFGPYTGTNVFVWAGPAYRGLDDALEEAAGWLADNAPGHLLAPDDPHLKDLIKETLEDEGKTWKAWQQAIEDQEQWAYDVEESAFADLTYTESGYLTSYEWTVNELSSDDDLYAEVFEASIDDIIDDMDEDDIDKANEVAEKLGIDARWEWGEH